MKKKKKNKKKKRRNTALHVLYDRHYGGLYSREATFTRCFTAIYIH